MLQRCHRDRPGADRGGERWPAWGSRWKLETLQGEVEPSVDTITSSIGQGAVSVTPLQMARLYAAIANGGCAVTGPDLVEGSSLSRENAGAQALPTLKVLRHKPASGGPPSRHATLPEHPGPAAGGRHKPARSSPEDPPRQEPLLVRRLCAGRTTPDTGDLAFGENSGATGHAWRADGPRPLMTTWFKVPHAQQTNPPLTPQAN